MEYTEAEILEQGLLYQSILDVLKQARHALTVQQIADETGLDESEVAQAVSELDEIHKVSGEVVHAEEVDAEIGCSVAEVREEFGRDTFVIPDLYTVLG
jgi:predicted transcriptional regulator